VEFWESLYADTGKRVSSGFGGGTRSYGERHRPS
jgi:hypothetical protein